MSTWGLCAHGWHDNHAFQWFHTIPLIHRGWWHANICSSNAQTHFPFPKAFFHSRHFDFVIVGKAQMLPTTWLVAQFYSSATVSHGRVTVSRHVRYQDPGTQAAKWNSAIVHFIMSNRHFPTVKVCSATKAYILCHWHGKIKSFSQESTNSAGSHRYFHHRKHNKWWVW